jgi:hypothetical protein
MPEWSPNKMIPVRNETALKYLSHDKKLTQSDIKRGCYECPRWIAQFGKVRIPNYKITIEEFQRAFGISNDIEISHFR